MCPNGTLSPIIARQAEIGGSYVIVSLADDCTDSRRKDRLDAMRSLLDDVPNKDQIHLDFYDRSKLHQWLRQHPSVMLWVRGALGQSLSGWRPFGPWSNPPAGADDTLILAPGISVTLPTGEKLDLQNAIEPVRNLVRKTTKAIRITGLSGVGKTRFVQALFEDDVGEKALDRTQAVYVDIGANPDPSANRMLDMLIAENCPAIMVIDNCPPDLHSRLASRVSSAGSRISLITVEYDIRDDKPQTTEVVQITADGPDIAEQLVFRRFPTIGQVNARRIANFADGNARVALAVAERAEDGESLAHLSDAQLFDRLFHQRNQPEGNLRQHAEILSLVYSFSVKSLDVEVDELAVLGEIGGISREQLFRSTSELLRRGIAQQRSHWRAILPHAIANRLANDALANVPIETLLRTFEAPGRERLLLSFAHRLGLMHDHPVAQQIVKSWLVAGGRLRQVSALDDMNARILDYIAPVAPEAVLERIEEETNSPEFSGFDSIRNLRRTTILRILQSLAYEPALFDRCIRLLVRVADFEDGSNSCDAVTDRIVRFFQAYLSGTHASLEQRLAWAKSFLSSNSSRRQSLGLRMLETALGGPPWLGDGSIDFGARPRDFGYSPNYEELADWRRRFLSLAVEFGNLRDVDLASKTRAVLAQKFRGLWDQQDIRDDLIKAARTLNRHHPWVEGWKAVRSIIYFDYRKKAGEEEIEPIPGSLASLEAELAPKDLMAKIMTYVLGKGHRWELDDEFDDSDPNKYSEADKRLAAKVEELGEEFARSCQPIETLLPGLFSTEWMAYRHAFGRGLAKGAFDQQETWSRLVEAFHRHEPDKCNFAVLSGFMEALDETDRSTAQALLDQCLDDALLRPILVGLHPAGSFDEKDLDRCISALEHPDVTGFLYGDLLWRDSYAGIPQKRLRELAERLLDKPNGDAIVLDALSMKLHRASPAKDALGREFRRIGLKAAARIIKRSRNDPGGTIDHALEKVIEAALSFDGNEDLKTAWLDAIFSVIDERHGYVHSFENAVRVTAAKCPEEFLDRVFSGDEETQRTRIFLLERGGLDKTSLGAIAGDTLIEWCNRNRAPEVWRTVAASINPWVEDGTNNRVELSEQAIKFLEAAPSPDEILGAYASKIAPMFWSGSRADIMESRLGALESLMVHSNEAIASAAESIVPEVKKQICREREAERSRDEEREQTFE
ncbi:hypothetical protein SAMN05421751_1333 [Jhaorihella thermophila]|uniref:Uncharacterized protein n=2 Tax=Jhaorihella thermophila TaxID=488547 RepID=A0A1H5Z9J5_9RHOB|nr:hypothetical protein SAMN05421751_1333 [Jhaorihella thermophila]